MPIREYFEGPLLMKTFQELEVTKEQVDEILEKYRVKLKRRILKQSGQYYSFHQL